jgi:hypothetical protein
VLSMLGWSSNREVTMDTRDPRSGTEETLEFEHHVEREALILQLRALATAVQRLADAIQQLGPEPLPPAVEKDLEEARWQLRQIW